MQDLKTKAAATIQAVAALYEAIAGHKDGIPSGHLYAAVMGHLTMEQYNALIGMLKRSGLVTESGFLLKAAPLPKAA